MKKAFAFVFALSLMVGLCACGGPSGDSTKASGSSDNGTKASEPSDDTTKALRTVSFDGTELTVTLGTNKSTGYEWDYEIYGECIEPSINRTFKVTGSNGDATGEVSIGFEGTSEGTAVIVLTTPNGWGGTGEGDGYTVNVEVAADGKIVNASGTEGAAVPKTSLAIAELADGTYTGEMPGLEYYSGENDALISTLSPADITVAIENGQITLYCEATATSIGNPDVIDSPRSPEYPIILSGSLPLTQSGGAVIAEGKVPALGQSALLNYNTDTMTFTDWEMVERASDQTYTCAVNIVMTDGVPLATITVGVNNKRITTVPLALN